MTLLQLISAMEAAAASQPAVNMIVRQDVRKLNDYAACRYGAFAWQQSQHRGGIGREVTDYGFNLFYVDRVLADASNEVEVQGTAVEVLGNILRTLAEQGVAVSDWTIETFRQRFKDDCAGAWASVTLTAPVGVNCAAEFTEREILTI